MRAFICWSGSRSRQLAERLSSWLPGVCGGGLSCGISTQFDAGEQWFAQLLRELDGANVAVICLTPENLESPWLHFEAGLALRTGTERVLPYFLGPVVPDIKGPLNPSQASPASADGTWRLVQALGRIVQADEAQMRPRFEERWPELSRFLAGVAAPALSEVFPGFEALFERKTFREPIVECTDQGWISRYDGARETLLAVERRLDVVERCCQPWQVWMYRKLLSQLDGYVRNLRENLLQERRFESSATGTIDFGRPKRAQPAPPLGAIAASCARRCREIRHIEFCLTKPEGAPHLAQALQFAKMSVDQFDDKKRLVQSKGTPVDRAALGIESDADLERCAHSLWDFDRIIYYRVRLDEPVAAQAMANLVQEELDRTEADGPGASKMPLHYAVKAWLGALEKTPSMPIDAVQADRVIDAVQAFLDRTARPNDDDPKIRRHLADIRRIARSAPGRAAAGESK
ncbi:MAG: toll/interleukin-1 receptor domain-containing protein [Proteobacteria bacterium]|nr:toll/interleukin-1 receptor domain-containing protein [Pseudomonadota bacterium]